MSNIMYGDKDSTSLAGGGEWELVHEPDSGIDLSSVPCEVHMSLERYQRYQAVATLAFSRGLIPEATLPALVDFLLAEFGKAVTEHVRDVVENFYALAEEPLEGEE